MLDTLTIAPRRSLEPDSFSSALVKAWLTRKVPCESKCSWWLRDIFEESQYSHLIVYERLTNLKIDVNNTIEDFLLHHITRSSSSDPRVVDQEARRLSEVVPGGRNGALHGTLLRHIHLQRQVIPVACGRDAGLWLSKQQTESEAVSHWINLLTLGILCSALKAKLRILSYMYVFSWCVCFIRDKEDTYIIDSLFQKLCDCAVVLQLLFHVKRMQKLVKSLEKRVRPRLTRRTDNFYSNLERH